MRQAAKLERHYSAKTIAELFDVSLSKVRQAMMKKPGSPGYLHSVLVGIDSRRVPESSLQAWLRNEAVSPKMASVHEIRRSK